MTTQIAAYLVKGDEPVLVAERLRALVKELTGGDALAVEDFNAADDVDASVIVDALQTPPFLADRRVVVVREAGALKGADVDHLVAYLADPAPTATLVLATGGGAISQRLVNALKKVGHVEDTTVASRPKERTTWVAARVKESAVALDGPALQRLTEHLGEDVSRLPGLLDALTASYGEGARIGVDELAPFLGDAGGVAPWDLTDAIDQGSTELALERLRRLVTGGARHPLELLAILHRHYANMLRLDGAHVRNEDDAAALLGMRSVFPAKKALTQARRLGSGKIARAILLLSDADLDMKGDSEWPAEQVMEVLVARLAALSAGPSAKQPGRGGRAASRR